MRAVDGNAEYRERRTNSMGKKLLVGFLIIAVLAAAGVWIFQRYAATKPKILFPGESTNRIVPRETTPSSGMSGSKQVAIAPPETNVTRGVVAEFQPRTGETLDFAAKVTKLDSTVA